MFSTDPDFLETKEEITKSTELLAFARLWRNCKIIFRKKSKKQTKKDFSIKNFLTNRLTFQLACLETFEMKAKTAIQLQSIIHMVGPHSRDQRRKVSCYDTQQFIKGQTLRHPKYYYSRPHFPPKLFYTFTIYMKSMVFGQLSTYKEQSEVQNTSGPK